MDVFERIKIAKDESLSEKIMTKLAEDKSWQVRVYIAKNPNITEEASEKLSNDENPRVIRCLLENKNISQSVLDKFSKHSFSSRRAQVASHPKTSVKTLRKMLMVSTESWDVMENIIKNPNIPKNILKALASCKNSAVRMAVLDNPNIDDEVKEEVKNTNQLCEYLK